MNRKDADEIIYISKLIASYYSEYMTEEGHDKFREKFEQAELRLKKKIEELIETNND